jgi:hypothetical protein
LRALLGDARVSATGAAPRVLAAIGDEDVAPGLMDRLIHADYHQSGSRLLTFDREAARLDGARLLSG